MSSKNHSSNKYKYEQENLNKAAKIKFTMKFLLCVIIIICLVTGLGVLRFNAARLAYYLDTVNQSIQKYSEEELKLRQELSGLVAPIRIYSYCKENLGMQKVLKADTVTIKVYGDTMARKPKDNDTKDSGWGSGFAWFLKR
ncbi:MAG: cell division protein FtsL [Synergistaceae bacterium]|nr:cell division protein FtsL [Synergistaceae bacterium]